MSYILVVDDEPDILEIVKLCLQMSTSLKIELASSGNKAMKLISEKGNPSLIISDYMMPDGDGVFLYQQIIKDFPAIPFVVCSGNPLMDLQKNFPKAYSYLQKPSFMKPLQKLIEEFSSESLPHYFKISILLLGRIRTLSSDLYIKLSDRKYVKAHNSNEDFTGDDILKYSDRGIKFLYLPIEKKDLILEAFDDLLQRNIKTNSSSGRNTIEFALELCQELGWSQDMVKVATRTVDHAIKSFQKNPGLSEILKKQEGNEAFSRHVSLLSLVVCLVSQRLGWTSESTQEKLIFASLMHDHFVDQDHYISQKQPDDAFKLHPIKAAELARSLKGLPNDLDHILMQHHEKPDGSGFPRGLQGQYISPLSAVFIISEDIINYLEEHSLSKETINDFWMNREMYLRYEPFKKVALSLIPIGENL